VIGDEQICMGQAGLWRDKMP